MNIEKPDFIVGAKKNTDGTMDYSKAAILKNRKTDEPIAQETPPLLTKVELANLSRQFLSTTEYQKNIRLKQIGKQKNSSPEEILQEVRLYKKAQIKENENGKIRHFHRTNIDNFRVISEMGRLLSRSKLKKEKPDYKMSSWSSSDDVMMTRDKLDSKGRLVKPGFHEEEVIGASGSGVMLVFNDSIMDIENYDATSQFPTISDLPLEDNCETILVDTNSDKKLIQQVLSSNNLNIPVSLKSNWSR